MKKTVSSLGLLIALSPLAMAQDDSSFYIGPRVGASLLNDNCELTDCTSKEVGGGLIAGYAFANGFSIESTYDYLGRFDTRDKLNVLSSGEMTAFTISPKINFGITETIDIYGKVGAAFWNWNSKPTSFNDVSVMTALGLDHRANDLVNLRLEYQYTPGMELNTLGTINADHHYISAGITFHFGRSSAPVVVPVPEETYQEEIVYEEVYEEPITAPEQVLIFESSDGASFKFGKAELSQSALVSFEPMLKRLQDYAQATATIDGYTDNTGPNEINVKLSEERAQSVANYFIQNGITADRMTVTGHGSSNPVASNDTREGRATNRRVEIKSPEFLIEQ